MRKIRTALFATVLFLAGACVSSRIISDTEAVSAKIVMEVNRSGDPAEFPKEIYINGELAGCIPASVEKWGIVKEIPLQEKAFRKLATENAVQITNKAGDTFKIRNIYLEVVTKNGQRIKSDIEKNIFCSHNCGWPGIEGKTAVYCGAPLPVFTLTLPTDVLGFIDQPGFHYEIIKGKNNVPKDWKGLEDAALPETARGRTSSWLVYSDLDRLPKEEILKKLQYFNSGDFASIISLKARDSREFVEKIRYLRSKGYKYTCAFSKISSDGWLPGSEKYKNFFETVAFWAKESDCIMVDEWWFSPALLQTEGGTKTVITDEFKNAMKKFSGMNDEDIKWAFKNPYSDDPRSLKAWEFCSKTGNDFMRNFVRTAKESNPKVRTSISYITHDWNKLVSGLDSCVAEFDEILNCQTYWYGRHSFDALDAAKVTNAIGVGKLFQKEYPGKFTWLGFGPRWTGHLPEKKEMNKFWKNFSHYGNTPEEIVPYLATLYASGDGVFIFVAFNGCAPGNGADDDFADVVRLVSQLVPRVKDYVKGDVAYYYDPETTFELVRTKPAAADYARREGDIVSIGYLQQYFDVDIVNDVSPYRNIVAAGRLYPSFMDDIKDRKVYLMYDPQYEMKGNKAVAAPLEKIGIKSTDMLKAGYYSIEGDVKIEKAMLYATYFQRNPVKPLRTASELGNDGKKYCIGAESTEGNVRINGLCPYYSAQSVMKPILKEDFQKFGWIKRDCPQINGRKNLVAVAFREPRKAVLDFGDGTAYDKVRIVVFNGKDGVVRNEIVDYKRGMEIDLPPLNVLTASGIER